MGQYFPKPKHKKRRTDRVVTNDPTEMTQVVQVITHANKKTGVPVYINFPQKQYTNQKPTIYLIIFTGTGSQGTKRKHHQKHN